MHKPFMTVTILPPIDVIQKTYNRRAIIRKLPCTATNFIAFERVYGSSKCKTPINNQTVYFHVLQSHSCTFALHQHPQHKWDEVPFAQTPLPAAWGGYPDDEDEILRLQNLGQASFLVEQSGIGMRMTCD